MKITYRVNKRVAQKGKRRRLQHKNGKLDLPQYADANWESPEVHREIREIIMQENPGWSISGYALVREGEDS